LTASPSLTSRKTDVVSASSRCMMISQETAHLAVIHISYSLAQSKVLPRHPTVYGSSNTEHLAAISYGMMKLFQNESNRRQIFAFDRTIIETLECLFQNIIDLILHRIQFARRTGGSDRGQRGQNPVSMNPVLFFLIARPIVPQPHAGRTKPRKKQN